MCIRSCFKVKFKCYIYLRGSNLCIISKAKCSHIWWADCQCTCVFLLHSVCVCLIKRNRNCVFYLLACITEGILVRHSIDIVGFDCVHMVSLPISPNFLMVKKANLSQWTLLCCLCCKFPDLLNEMFLAIEGVASHCRALEEATETSLGLNHNNSKHSQKKVPYCTFRHITAWAGTVCGTVILTLTLSILYLCGLYVTNVSCSYTSHIYKLVEASLAAVTWSHL